MKPKWFGFLCYQVPKTILNDASQDSSLCMIPSHLEPGWAICNQWTAVELTLYNSQAESCRTSWLWFLGTFILRLSFWNPVAILWKVHATYKHSNSENSIPSSFGTEWIIWTSSSSEPSDDCCPHSWLLQPHVSPQARTTQLTPVNLQSHKTQR